MRAARPAVKYSVVNHAKEVGLLRAIPVKRTVQRGNKLVAMSAIFTYPSKIFSPSPFSSGAAAVPSA
jgi:hypothetical protein